VQVRGTMRLAEGGALTGLGKAVVAVLTFWALLFVGPDFYRVVVPFWTLGFSADQSGVVTRVSPELRASATIAVNDQIDLDAMSCGRGLNRCRDLMAVIGGMGGMQYVAPEHSPLTFTIVRNGDEKKLHVTVTPRPPQPEPAIWERAALALDEILGIFFILVGAVLVWECPSIMTAGFFLYATWFNPGQYFVSYAWLQPYPQLVLAQETLQGLLQAAGYAGLIVFALRFPENAPDPAWRRIEIPLALVAASAVLILQLWSFADAFGIPTATITNNAYYAGYAVDIAVTAILFLRLAGKPAEVRQRIRWVFWGCAIGLTAFIFADSNEATTIWNWLWDPPEGLLDLFFAVNATLAITVFYAVRHHRVVNVSFAISRSATLLTTWIVAGGVLAFVSLELEPHLERWLQRPIFVITIVILTLGFERLHEHINEVCDRLFFPSLHDADARLLEEGKRTAGAGSHETVDRSLVEAPVAAFRVTSAAVFRFDGNAFIRRHAFGWDEGNAVKLAHHSALAMHAEKRDRPFRIDEAGRCEEDFPREAAFPAIVVPVRAHGELLALALYGPHLSGDDLNSEECALLARFAADAARGYDRAEIIALRKRLSELLRGVSVSPAAQPEGAS
jgi:hypothetical protein